MEPLPATFYREIDQKNPVIATFGNEIKQLLGFMRKVLKAPSGSTQQQDYKKGSSTLFHIWVKYKPRLPAWYYEEKLLKVGDSLVQIKEYKMALFQCFGRYLEQFCSVDIDAITDVHQFKATFFPNGTDDKNAGLTFHALQGRCICIYQLVKTSDANLQNPESVKKCVNILSFLQLIMQVVLPQEHLCWLIFNGTLHIYTICRHLMVLGHSSKALEFLLWASVCMETSVPLLAVHYLTWRATLYTAVCQCYFDCQVGVHGEVFARRALSKINELSQLENMSNSSYSEEAKTAFREATCKMAVMIFKRAVFESRRKPKGILRPKQKSNLKDAEKLPWPRTNTERLLVEMFSNGAAQFLAILEALSDSNRRVLVAGPPIPDEPEIYDVIAELFFAGIDIVLGGGNKAERGARGHSHGDMCKLLKQSPLLELAVEGKDAVSAEAVVKFAKLAFSYEQWDVFDAIIIPIHNFLQAQENTKWKKHEMDLRILISAAPLLSGRKHKYFFHLHENHANVLAITSSLGIVEFQGESLQDRPSDDYITLAETVFFCACNSLQEVRPDRDIVIDVTLFLWQKCKNGLQRIYAATPDGLRFVQKCEAHSKWIYILCLIYEVMQHCNIVDTDAVIMGEAALKLAGVSESMADATLKCGRKSDKSLEKENEESSTELYSSNKSIHLKKNPVTQLTFAYETLDKAIKGMSLARSHGSVPDETSVIDHYCATLGVKRQHLKNTAVEQNISSKSLANNAMVMDLQLELIMTQHRVSLKLLHLLQGDRGQLRSSKSSLLDQGRTESLGFRTESEIMDKINKNKLSKAIFLMQKAVLCNKGLGNASPSQLLEDSEKLIQKAESEENAVYLSCVKPAEPGKSGKKTVPPPPILLCRTEHSMVFKPAPFKPDIKVSWYCLFGRCVTGPDVRVRLNDHHLPGTGEEIPAYSSNLLEVKGLVANEKYIFAVAAYSSDGVLIGDTIGESTKPILAFPPLSVPATWAYLAQSAYQVGNYTVAKKAVSVLWNYFVLPPITTSADVSVSANDKHYVSQKRLWLDIISKSSPILLQLFLGSIFISSDINIKEGALFCDSLCNNGVLRKWQISRIAECERLLVALDVCSWLSDANSALQAVVQCYGLIAPIIYHKIPSVPVVQILMKCLAVLQEIPSSTWQKKQVAVTEGVLHMIACTVYYVAKVLRSWEEYELAVSVIEAGKKLLDTGLSSFVQSSQPKLPSSDEVVKETGDKEKGNITRKYQKKKIPVAEKVNEQLAVLEVHLLKLINPSNGTELTGQEDPMLLYSVVTCWPPLTAYKEVMKFKKKPRFLEFFVQLLQRVVYEEKFQRVLEWADTVLDYLKRRNENVFGSKKIDEIDVTMPNDSFRRYMAALVEYHKDKESSALKKAKKQIKPEKTKDGLEIQLKKRQHPLELHRSSGDDVEKRAYGTLYKLLAPIVSRYIKRKRLLQTCNEEIPWRSQMNLLLAFTHFGLFRKKLDQFCRAEPGCAPSINSYRILDPEIFSLPHAGTVVMATETNAADEQIASPGHLHPSLKLHLPSESKLTDSNDFSEPSTKRSETDTPRTQMTNDTETCPPPIKEEAKINMSSVILFDHLGKIYIHLKRAMVLAHRGGHWTLLQNTCRVLWNVTLELQLITKQNDINKELFPLTRQLLNNELWLPFYFAADMILDMIVILQNNGSVKVVDTEEAFCVPSCMGGIVYEEGGSNLTFDYPFDDVNVVDMRWMRDLVLKAIEVLYSAQRWEALVHLAIQFNILTHERYTEQVTPLLVHAQRMLASRIRDISGSAVTEPFCNKYMADHEEKINCRNYIGKQLHVATVSKKVINPGTDIDWKGHIVDSDVRQAEALVCVPLDVTDTLACFRETLQKSKYSSRALRHSRKLLALFLAHDQGLNALESVATPYGMYGRIGFSAGAVQAHKSVPPDLSEEEFNSLCSIENKAIPPSHFSVVVSSYDKTIEILHADNQQDLKAQALHELGNLHLYAGNKRAAFKCWCLALDETLNMSDALNSWQELDSSPDSICNGRSKDYSEKFLSRAGIWGCLQAAVITAKMSRYILTSNLRKRTECCILSAILFKALFLVSLPHPEEDCDYALYEIGKGCEISELIPGIDLFSDRYRADINTVTGCLIYVMSELHSASQNLMLLPLFTLYQYFVSMICRDPVRSVEGRLLKIKVLTDLHLFTEAYHELHLLNHGKRIPNRPQQHFKPAGKNMTVQKFSSSEFLLASDNLKGILLSEAEKRTSSILEDLLVKYQYDLSQCSAVDLEMAIEAKLQLSEIAQQRHQTAVSVAMAYSALQLLQGAKIFTVKHTRPTRKVSPTIRQHTQQNVKEDLQNKFVDSSLPSNMEARERLNMRMWLRCRLAIVTSLAGQMRGISIQDEDLLDISSVITEGIAEAETLSDIETQAHLILQAAFLDIQEGRPKKGIQLLLEDLINLLEGKHLISPAVCLTFAQSLMLSADLMEMENDQDQQSFLATRLSLYVSSHKLITKQLSSLGEVVEEHATNPIVTSQTFKNIYLPHLNLLAKVKLRIGLQSGSRCLDIALAQDWGPSYSLHGRSSAVGLTSGASASPGPGMHSHSLPSWVDLEHGKVASGSISASRLPGTSIQHHEGDGVSEGRGHVVTLKVCSVHESMDPTHMLPSLNLYTTALELCRISSFKEYDVEADLLFQKGKIEHHMFLLGDLEKSLAIKSFSEAINICLNYDQNLSLIKKSYLEIALLYSHMARLDTKRTTTMVSPVTEDMKSAASKEKVDSGMENDGTEGTMTSVDLCKLLTWIAIRAATQVGNVMLACKQLIGMHSVTVQPLKAELHEHIPLFACMDLLTAYKKYLPDDCQGRAGSPRRDGDDLEILPTETFSWVHLIRYHNHLMRLRSMINLKGCRKPLDGRLPSCDTLYTPVFRHGVTVRFVAMHRFLKKYLHSYGTCCANEFPHELLQGLENLRFNVPLKTVTESKEFHLSTSSSMEMSSNNTKLDIPNEPMATNSVDKELCVQWYFPSPEKSQPKKSMVLLLYAYNQKYFSAKDLKTCDPAILICGHVWIPLLRAVSMHEKLSVLKQKAEISLQPVMDSLLSERGEKMKGSGQTAKSKTNLKAITIPEELQAPFDVALPSLISLENIFDLTHGCMLMKGSLLDWIVSQLT
ncbi:cilia- and flagella-associated protein 54 [Rhinophrynus dorsalis]